MQIMLPYGETKGSKLMKKMKKQLKKIATEQRENDSDILEPKVHKGLCKKQN